MNRIRRHRGFIFVTAIVALMVMLLIGTTFMSVSAQQLRDSRRALEAVHAIAMADAGLNYVVWRQRYSGNPIADASVLPANTDLLALGTADGATANISPLQLGTGDKEDRSQMWLLFLNPPGTTTGYQLISRGLYRDHDRKIRAILQGNVQKNETEVVVVPPPQLKYAIFTKSDLTVGESTNVIGDLGSNGNIVLDTSGGGSVTSNLYTAGSVTFKKNTTFVIGSVTYGYNLYDGKGDVITNPTGVMSGASANGATTQVVPGIVRESYKTWADRYGSEAIFNETNLNNPDRVRTPIFYVNSNNLPGFTLDINANLQGPLTIFVNGNIRLNGGVRIGTALKPVVLIATGSVDCNGTPDINGVVWAQGTFGNGTPIMNGSVVCDNLAAFKGNVQINYKKYDNVQVVPPDEPDYQNNKWGVTSWEQL